MKKVLITGCNGFVGRAVGGYCASKGYRVYGVDVNSNESEEFIFMQMDLLSEDIDKLWDFVRPDIIIHCAGIANVSFSMNHPVKDFEINVSILHKMLFSMLENNLVDAKFIFVSSAGVYGQPTKLPIDELCEKNPISPYALHKAISEDICMYFAIKYNMDIRIARIFSAYGPGLKKQIFWDMYQKIKLTGELQLWGTGAESRDFIYIDDLVRALLLIAECEQRDYFIWNVANGDEVQIKYIADVFAKKMNMDIAIKFSNETRSGDPNNWCADISRIKELGYVQHVSIEEGIEKYIRWINEQEN